MVAFNKTYRKTLTPDRSAKDSGLRYYSPEISRRLSRDPIGEEWRLNLYAGFRNDPINPSGPPFQVLTREFLHLKQRFFPGLLPRIAEFANVLDLRPPE